MVAEPQWGKFQHRMVLHTTKSSSFCFIFGVRNQDLTGGIELWCVCGGGCTSITSWVKISLCSIAQARRAHKEERDQEALKLKGPEDPSKDRCYRWSTCPRPQNSSMASPKPRSRSDHFQVQTLTASQLSCLTLFFF